MTGTASDIRTQIREYDLSTRPVISLIDLIWDNWKYPGDMFWGHPAGSLHMHTGGWGENELIMSALRENELFYSLYWRMSERGGHYTFLIEGGGAQ